MNLSIRTRLTIWNAAVTATLIMSMGVVVYFSLAKALLNHVDAVLLFEYRETVERLEQLGANEELGGVPEAFLEEFQLRVTDPSGRIRMESPNLRGAFWKLRVVQTKPQNPILATEAVGTLGEQRTIAGQVGGSHEGWNVQIASSLTEYRREMLSLRNTLLLLFPFGLLISLVAGHGLAGRALKPVERLTQAAQKISANNLDERIQTDRTDDELGHLASTLNAMIDRLASSLEATRRFTADASHELMTPLAQIRAEAEVALQAERTARQYSQVLYSIVEEVERLTRIADQLLALANTDADIDSSPIEFLSLRMIICAAVSALNDTASKAGVNLAIEDFHDITISLSADRLRLVLDNLIRNGILYNRPEGHVKIHVRRLKQYATIAIEDTGIGIPPDQLPLIFDRFYRVDKARSRCTGGIGLGLSIARAVVETMGGRIEVESEVGKGSTFRIVIPVVQATGSQTVV
jgi:heavy metal sensor kinase